MAKNDGSAFPWNSGFISSGTELYPYGIWSGTFWERHSECHRRLLQAPILKEHADFDNSAQVMHAARFIFSRDGNFDLAKDMCRQAPELRNQDHPELVSHRGDEIQD